MSWFTCGSAERPTAPRTVMKMTIAANSMIWRRSRMQGEDARSDGCPGAAQVWAAVSDYRDVDETPFRFGLERVRELREHDEDRAREEFAASLTRRRRDAAALDAAADLVAQARDARLEQSGAHLTGQDLIAHQLWLERVEADRRKAELE